jgi:hypothetical protein
LFGGQKGSVDATYVSLDEPGGWSSMYWLWFSSVLLTWRMKTLSCRWCSRVSRTPSLLRFMLVSPT